MDRRTLRALFGSLAVVAAIPGAAIASESSGWKGCYAGLHLGWAGASSTIVDELYATGAFAGLTAWNPPGEAIPASSDGVIGGGQIGCDTPVATQQGMTVVLGAVGDISGLDASGTSTSAISSDTSVSFSADFIATLRARLGLAQGAYLAYATAGVAFADLSVSASDLSSAVNFGQMAISGSGVEVGWVVGGGLEWRIANNWSLGVEYLHMDFGSTTAIGEALNIPGAFPTFSGDLDIDTVRAVLNWRM